MVCLAASRFRNHRQPSRLQDMASANLRLKNISRSFIDCTASIITSAEISNIYGPFQQGNRRQGLVAATIRRALLKEPVEIWGDGEVIRDFVYVDDVVAAMLHGCIYGGSHKVMNVGSGTGLTVDQVIRDIELILDDGTIEKLYRPGRTADVPANILDTSLILSETRWRPIVSWHEGLCRSIDWMRESIVASDPETIREYADQALKFPIMSSGKPATAQEFEA